MANQYPKTVPHGERRQRALNRFWVKATRTNDAEYMQAKQIELQQLYWRVNGFRTNPPAIERFVR